MVGEEKLIQSEKEERPAEGDAGPQSDAFQAVPPPSPKEDLEVLYTLNWYKDLLIMLQRGEHPDPTINALLARRMPIPREEVVGPYVLRLLNTLALVFVACTFTWLLVWSVSSILGLTYFVQAASALFVTLLVAVLCIAVFQPMPSLDEKKIEEAGKQFLEALRQEAFPENSDADIETDITLKEPDLSSVPNYGRMMNDDSDIPSGVALDETDDNFGGFVGDGSPAPEISEDRSNDSQDFSGESGDRLPPLAKQNGKEPG